jgi:hypothetical protein
LLGSDRISRFLGFCLLTNLQEDDKCCFLGFAIVYYHWSSSRTRLSFRVKDQEPVNCLRGGSDETVIFVLGAGFADVGFRPAD